LSIRDRADNAPIYSAHRTLALVDSVGFASMSRSARVIHWSLCAQSRPDGAQGECNGNMRPHTAWAY
jgi:hypothetical protein